LPLLFKRSEASPQAPAQSETILYRGNDITNELWGLEVDSRLELIARDPVRRNEILDYHHEILEEYPLIAVAGRDIATTLLRNATLHVFLTANFAVRRERRRAQHLENPTRSVVVGAITRRDIATLNECRQLDWGVVLDTTYLSPSVILNYIVARVNEAIEARGER
jgi:cytidylate kinase